MSDLVRLDAATLGAKIAAKDVSSTEVTQAHLDQIAATDDQYHAFLHVGAEAALAQAGRVDAAVAAGETLPSALTGVPLALKDVFTTTDMPTTCGSRILEGWRSPYDATVTARLRAAGIPILGKTNMDEFAMGSSTENSAYGTGCVPGPAGDRIRHGRFDPPACRIDRHRRRQAHVRDGVALRAHRMCVIAGPRRTLCAHGARHRAASPGHRRSRPSGFNVGAGRRARRGRRGDGRGGR
jgi:hypothetical protein